MRASVLSVRRRLSARVVSGNQEVLSRSEIGRLYLNVFSPRAKGVTGRRSFAERKALTLVERFRDDQTVPGWFYRSMLAQVYEFARRRDEAIGELEQAVELAPDDATMLISLARHVLTHKRDARRARELLDDARGHALTEMTSSFADLVEGLVLLEEGRPRDAIPVLEAVHRVFHARRRQPLGYLPLEHAMLGLALGHASLGESDKALTLYAKVRPRLVALRSQTLERCDRAIGLPREA
jgi:tetratricopeptide (TPR) repeat protein